MFFYCSCQVNIDIPFIYDALLRRFPASIFLAPISDFIHLLLAREALNLFFFLDNPSSRSAAWYSSKLFYPVCIQL
jgi:hypothetical protein